MAPVVIENMLPSDWPAVEAIYNEGIATCNATFEVAAPFGEEWDRHHLGLCRLVARLDGLVVGWAALSPISGRYAYRGVAEVSVYVAEAMRRQGIGKALLSALIEASERAGIWTLQASIFPENTASLALHKRCGFRVVGRRERLGQLRGRWRDVILMERRSTVVRA